MRITWGGSKEKMGDKRMMEGETRRGGRRRNGRGMEDAHKEHMSNKTQLHRGDC